MSSGLNSMSGLIETLRAELFNTIVVFLRLKNVVWDLGSHFQRAQQCFIFFNFAPVKTQTHYITIYGSDNGSS